MSVKLLRSVSIIALSASLAMPAPIMAQTQPETPVTEACPDGSLPVTEEGSDAPVCPPDAGAAETPLPADDAPEQDAQADAAEAAAPASEDVPEADAQVEAADDSEAAGDDVPEASDEASEAAESDTASDEIATQAEESADENADLGEAPAAEADADDVVTDDAAEPESAPDVTEDAAADTPAETDSTAATEDPASADPQAQPQDETVAEEPAQTEEQAATQSDADTAQDDTAAEAEPAEPATDEPAAEAAEDTAGADQTEAADEDAAATDQSDAADEDAATADQTEAADEDAAAAVEDDVAGEQEASEVVQEDTADTTAVANETVQTEAASEGADAQMSDDDTVETVTEETARSSDEEFATTTAATAEGSSGLSNLERFALGALGVATIATVLNQRDQVVVSSDDRLVVRDDSGAYRVLKNDDELLRRPGVQVATREFSDGSTRSVVTRENGERVVTIRAPNGQALKRTRILADGREVVLFDDTINVEPVEMSFLEQYRPQDRRIDANDPDALRAALQTLANPTDRAYSLQQIRQIRGVRDLVPEIELDNVNFETGSAVISPQEAEDLSQIGRAIAAAIEDNPNEVFLIEGHTDAVGSAAMNLALSDRRAESVALALTEYFDIPPENLVVQGYGEANLKVLTNLAERENRRVAVRQITPLLYSQR